MQLISPGRITSMWIGFSASTATACHPWTLQCSATIGRLQKCWSRSARRRVTSVSTQEFIFVTFIQLSIHAKFPDSFFFKTVTGNDFTRIIYLATKVIEDISRTKVKSCNESLFKGWRGAKFKPMSLIFVFTLLFYN